MKFTLDKLKFLFNAVSLKLKNKNVFYKESYPFNVHIASEHNSKAYVKWL